MTINSHWVEILKKEAPSAFAPCPPFVGKVAYLDGMPLLMTSSTTRRWEDLVNFNFCNPVRRFYRMGTKIVVLAFDDYKFVPIAKSITQANRSKKKAKFEFNERQLLETVIPLDYNERVCNREYKRRVIDLVAETITDHIGLLPGQTLIIDYVDCPVKFEVNNGKVCHTYMTDIPPMGECDVKFTRWGRMYGDIIAHSVDGDFIPIALLEHERNIRMEMPQFKIGLYRMEYNMSKPTVTRKRDAQGAPKTESQGRKRRAMEFVNIPLLYDNIRAAMKKYKPSVQEHHDLQLMRILSHLIAISGTDFTRGMPHIGPLKIWEMMNSRRIWEGVIESYDTERMCMEPQKACDNFISKLYLEKFNKHANSGGGIRGVLSSLMASKLKDSTKALFPTEQRAVVTVKNSNWLIKYWECNQPVMRPSPTTEQEKETGDVWDYSVVYPDPVSCEFGFKMAEGRKNAVQWMDV